jgi:type I restriction enzyme R subunit
VIKIYEQFEVDDEAAEKFEKEYSQMYQIITNDERLDKVAEDIVYHYFHQDGDWKAMVVCIDKKTTVRMREKVQKEIDKLRFSLEKDFVKSADALEQQSNISLLEKIKHFDSAVVISFGDTQDDEKIRKEYDIVMRPHRERSRIENLKNVFKNKNSKLKMAFVCNMRLTGLDVPTLRTLYLDKPMRDHTLMQTITRVNRVAENKDNGLIVDYIGIFKNLQTALANYASDNNDGVDYPAQDKAELVSLIDEAIAECRLYIKTIANTELKELLVNE